MISQRFPAGPAGANLADLLRAVAADSGARPALIDSRRSRTWAELDAAADAGAAALSGHRVGERVVLALPTGADLAAALFAVLRAGLVAVPVDPRRTDLAWVAGRVGAVVTVTDESFAGPAAVLGSAEVSPWWETTAAPAPARAGGEDLAMLARSARTSPPVMLPHRAFVAAVEALGGAPLLDLRPDDRVLQILPLFHVVGLMTAFLPAALAGAAVVIPDIGSSRAPVDAALDAVRAHRVSILPAEPTLYRQLDRVPDFARALATVRLMTSGSSPLDPADFAAIRTATGQAVREGYGISESAAAVTSTLMAVTAHPGSVGLPYPGVELRILDGGPHGDEDARGDATADGGAGGGAVGEGAAEGAAGGPAEGAGGGPAGERAAGQGTAGGEVGDAAGGDAQAAQAAQTAQAAKDAQTAQIAKDAQVAQTTQAAQDEVDGDGMLADMSADDGDVGPIAIRGATLFAGYWPDGHGGPGPDGWYVTGDIGYTDDAGELHLVDRADETVVVAGFTVYPREVEDVLVSHPYVADAAVVGVPGRGGDTVVAALVAQPGTRPTPGDLDEYVATRLPPFKRPTGYQVVDVLPRTEVGRLDRESVRRGYARERGIPLDAPQLRAAVDVGHRGAAPSPEAGDQAGRRPSAPRGDVAPEAAAGLDRLGTGLPSAEGRGRRSARDTDEDLF